jgi:hypothetical protein
MRLVRYLSGLVLDGFLALVQVPRGLPDRCLCGVFRSVPLVLNPCGHVHLLRHHVHRVSELLTNLGNTVADPR